MSADNFSLKPVPASERKGIIALTFVMLGLTFFSASMWTGGTLGTTLTYDDFFLAVLIGNLMLGVYTSFLGYIGAKTGLTTHILARYSFGIKGSWLPSALLGGYSVYLAINDVGGLDTLRALMPKEPLSLSVAITLVVGSFISAGTLTADFVRFGKHAKYTVFVTMIAFFLGNSLMFIFGAAGAAVKGMADISDVMVAQGLLLPAIIVLGLNIWTTNDNALYASGLGFANITGVSSRILSVINGIVGTLCALWLYNNFVGWLTFLSAAIPPIGGIIIADYLTRRHAYQNFDQAHFVNINWAAVVSVGIGVACGKFLPGIIPVNAVISGAIAYLILNPLLRKKFA